MFETKISNSFFLFLQLVPLGVRSYQSPIRAFCVAPLSGTLLGAQALTHDHPPLTCASRSLSTQGHPGKAQNLFYTNELPVSCIDYIRPPPLHRMIASSYAVVPTFTIPQWDTVGCSGPDPRPSAVNLCFSVPEHPRAPWEGSEFIFILMNYQYHVLTISACHLCTG
jgi:hypothetical protein